jgi:hypothetical protein
MYVLLVRLMLLAALAEVGVSVSEFRECRGRECALRVVRASHEVLRINWKPISVFPEEARRLGLRPLSR